MGIERNCADYGKTENVRDEQNLYPEFQSGSDEQTVQKKGECKKGGAKAMANEKRLIDAIPCPCGKKAKLFSIDGPYGLKFYKLLCLNCKAFVTAQSKEKAIERWNMRMEYEKNHRS